MFAMIPASKAVHNKKKLTDLQIKTRPPIGWFIDVMKQMHTEKADIFSLIPHQFSIKTFTRLNSIEAIIIINILVLVCSYLIYCHIYRQGSFM